MPSKTPEELAVEETGKIRGSLGFDSWDPLPYDYQINFKGMFNFEQFYKMVYDWLKYWKFFARNGTKPISGDVNFEEFHSEVTIPGTTAKNHWIWWRTCRIENDMFHYWLDIDFQTLVLNTKEEMHKGVKVKMNDGELNIWFKPMLIVDPNGKWFKDSFSRMWIATIFRHRWLYQVDAKECDLTDRTGKLFELCKQYLGLYTLAKLDKSFHPELGFPQLG